MRYARVDNAKGRLTVEQLERYLPGNYKVMRESRRQALRLDAEDAFVIEGEDDHGWTLHEYVIPRLASGLIWAHEIEIDTDVVTLSIQVEVPKGTDPNEVANAINAQLDEPPSEWGDWTVGPAGIVE